MLLCVPLYLLYTLAADASAGPYVIRTVAGTDFVGDGGPATSAILSQAEGIAVDNHGNLYVADADDNRVRKVGPGGIIQTLAGTGAAGFGGDGGPAARAQLNHPYGLALDQSGNVYVADLGNARVRKIAVDGSISTVAGGGVVAASVSGTSALSVKLNAPRNLTLDRDGNLYISDFGASQVYRVTPGGTLTVFAGTGDVGAGGDGGLAALADLSAPAGLAFDSTGALLIADSGNNRIRKVASAKISTAYSLAAPTGVAVGATGTVYLAGAGYLGTPSRVILNVPALDLAVDAAGNLYFTAGALVERIASNGQLSIVAGNGAARYYGGDGGPASLARLHDPEGLALDDAGNLYIADTGNHRIRRISAEGMMTTLAGTGEPGARGDGGVALAGQLNGPRGIAVDGQRNVYIADAHNNRVRRVSAAGNLSTALDGLNDPEAVAVDAQGTLYIADTANDRVLRVTAGGFVTTLAEVVRPAGLAVDQTGNVFISESSRITRIAPNGTLTVMVVGLRAPRGIAVAENGDLIFAETGAHRVIRFSAATGITATIAGTGAPGFSGDGDAAPAAQLSGPAGVATDLTGSVWIADSGNNRVRLLTPPPPRQVASATVVHSATLAIGPVAPGEIVTIYGVGFDAKPLQVMFDGNAGQIFFANATQINARAPSALTPGSTVGVSMMSGQTAIAGAVVDVAAAAPGLFTLAGGIGPAAALNQDLTLNSGSNPAARGSIVVLFATGEGTSAAAVSLKIGDTTAELLYAGPAPGFPGLMQINARVPGGVAPSGNVPVVLSVGDASSQPGVTIAVQ